MSPQLNLDAIRSLADRRADHPTTTGDHPMANHLSSIENQISSHQDQIAVLRAAGARAAADNKMSGQAILNWLKRRGSSDAEARKMCVEIIHERRAAREAGTNSDVRPATTETAP